MPRAVRSVLIECDPSIKAVILKYDEETRDIVLDEMQDDERHMLINTNKLEDLKVRLGKDLDDKIMQPEEEESE